MKSDRRMFIECSIMLAICITFIGIWGFCIIYRAPQSKPMTQEEMQEAVESYTPEKEYSLEYDP